MPPGNRITIFIQQLRRYSETLTWLICYPLQHERLRLFQYLVCGFLGPTLQASVLGFLLFFARLLESDKPLTVVQFEIDPRDGGSFVLVTFVVLLALLFSALLKFWSDLLVARIASEFERFCSKQVLLQACLGIHSTDYAIDPTARRTLKKTSGNLARVAGRSLRMMLKALIPLLVLVYACCFALYLQPVASLMIFGLGLLFLWVHYRLNQKIYANEIRRRAISSPAGDVRAELIDALSAVSAFGSAIRHYVDRRYRESPLDESIDLYGEKIIASDRAELFGNLLISCGLIAVLTYLGFRALTGSISWARFVVYLVAFRMVLTSTRGIFITISILTKQYPGTRRLHAILTVPKPAELPDKIPQISPGSADAQDDQTDGLILKPGDSMALLSPVRLMRQTMGFFISYLSQFQNSGPLSEHGVHFITASPMPLDGFTLFDVTGIQSPDELDRIRTHILKGRNNPAFETLVRQYSLTGPIDASVWQQTPRETLDAIAIAAAYQSEAPVLLVAAQFAERQGERWDAWRKILNDRILIHVYERQGNRIGRFGESMACVVDYETVLVIDDPEEVRLRNQEFQRHFQEQEIKFKRAPGSVFDDADADDDDL